MIYVATSGSDSNAGTISSPLLTIQAAVNKAVAGDTIYLRAGTYGKSVHDYTRRRSEQTLAPTTNIQITKSGTSTAQYTLRNYGTEKVIIDGEALP